MRPEEKKKLADKKYREANKEKAKAWREANKEYLKAKAKAWREANKEKKSKQDKEYKAKNKNKIDSQNKKYREANKENYKVWVDSNKDKVNKRKLNYYHKNKEHLNNKRKENYINNKAVINKKAREYTKHKIKTDPLFKLTVYSRNMIRKALKRNGYSKTTKTAEILGCSFEQFKLHLEQQFESWMNWDNYGLYNGVEGYGWDIDHIVPLVSAKSEADIIRLNHYTNLRPLCSYINRVVKSGHI